MEAPKKPLKKDKAQAQASKGYTREERMDEDSNSGFDVKEAALPSNTTVPVSVIQRASDIHQLPLTNRSIYTPCSTLEL